MRALALQRGSASSPRLPTLDEAGVKGYDNSSWSAVGAPAGTPKEIITRLNGELSAILKMPDGSSFPVQGSADAIGGVKDWLRREAIRKGGR
jgi:tripartite-type tricarboxylate transporter receptor subunit TctC